MSKRKLQEEKHSELQKCLVFYKPFCFPEKILKRKEEYFKELLGPTIPHDKGNEAKILNRRA